MSDINWASYLIATRFSAAEGVVLARNLVANAMTEPPPPVARSIERMTERRVVLEALVDVKLEAGPSELQPLDQMVDKLWVGLRMALEAAARLEGTDRGERGASLLKTVFPQGTSFVMLNHRAQWLTADRILQRIERLGLDGELASIAGEDYLPRIRELHARYSEMIGAGPTPTSRPSKRAIATAIAELSEAIADYGRLMAGISDREDPDSLARFLRAMEPLDTYRARAFGGRGASEDAIDEVEDIAEEPTDDEPTDAPDPPPFVEGPDA
ncbi:MAG: hypothetical protein AB7S26_37220 [Sandaracinaceae bacterium]